MTATKQIQIGSQVHGQYCGSDFTGTVTKTCSMSWDAFRYFVQIDNPVDVCGAIVHPAGTVLIINYYTDCNRPWTNGFDQSSWIAAK